jgi:DMSO/TMAO reductase YedYZ molybdopterin-dependent catalytic subunit
MPLREDWKRMAESGFQDFRLKVGGLVEHPIELSLADLAKLGQGEHITMHHCIQGWSGIAKWGGIPMKMLIDLVRPKPEAKVVAFFSFGEALYGGAYYDTQSMENLLKGMCVRCHKRARTPTNKRCQKCQDDHYRRKKRIQ